MTKPEESTNLISTLMQIGSDRNYTFKRFAQ